MPMKTPFIQRGQRWALIFSLLLPFEHAMGQFVELTAEIEITDWDGLFFFDKLNNWPGSAGQPSIFTDRQKRHCVVGRNIWMIESESGDSKRTWWFTGTNIIQHSVVIKDGSESTRTRSDESIDGNPGRPVRQADLTGFDVVATVCWQAFCSGPVLRRKSHRIFPPSAFWKESSIVYSGWSEQTEVFGDSLGLPKSIHLVTTNNQSVFQYQAHRATNVLGWNFPLEVFGVQYKPTRTNGWELHLTVKGKVTAIGVGAEPQIPSKVVEAANSMENKK